MATTVLVTADMDVLAVDVDMHATTGTADRNSTNIDPAKLDAGTLIFNN